jgi:NAD(P)H-hydrate epimerase
MRDADRRTIEDVGIPSIVLMENAGRQIVAAMESTFESLSVMSVAVLCGRGNNGGDGFVVARTLIERDIDVAVYLFAASAEVRGDARINLDVLRNLGVDVVEMTDAAAWELHGREVLAADVIVDALVGTGLSAPLAGLYETVIADVNASPRPVVSVDLPSGLSADDHAVNGPAMDASLTVTLGAPKLPLVLPPGEALAGTLVIADIGIPAGVIEDVEGPWVEILTKEAMRQLVQPRAQDSHKGDYGRVLVVAGSPGKSGAAVLAGLAALRSGAGLVTVATPASQVPLVAAGSSECMTLALPEDEYGFVRPDAIDLIVEFTADVIAIGPGLGRTAGVRALVQAVTERSGVPLILDADAIVSFAGEPDRLVGRDGVDLIITPHPGEMAALIGLSTGRRAGASPRCRPRLCRHASAERRPQRTPHDRGDARGTELHQPDRQRRHGDRRRRRRAHGRGRRVGCATARRRSGLQAGGVSARARREIWPKPTKARSA